MLPELTVEELKEVAKNMGYSIIKKKPYTKVKPCPVCGKKKVQTWYGKDIWGECANCGFKGDEVPSESQRNEGWNNAVDRYLKEHSQNNVSV